jgi:hypothetical protein
VRDNTISAGIVAAFDDGQVGAEGIVAARNFGLEGFVDVEIEAHDAAAAGFELLDEVRQLAIAGGAADETDPRRALEDFFAFLLGDASEHADYFAAVFRGGLVVAKARKYFLRGLFADAAGVVEEQVGLRRVFCGTIAAPEKDARDFLGVVDVHLAAEGFDVEGFIGRLRLRGRGDRPRRLAATVA